MFTEVSLRKKKPLEWSEPLRSVRTLDAAELGRAWHRQVIRWWEETTYPYQKWIQTWASRLSSSHTSWHCGAWNLKLLEARTRRSTFFIRICRARTKTASPVAQTPRSGEHWATPHRAPQHLQHRRLNSNSNAEAPAATAEPTDWTPSPQLLKVPPLQPISSHRRNVQADGAAWTTQAQDRQGSLPVSSPTSALVKKLRPCPCFMSS